MLDGTRIGTLGDLDTPSYVAADARAGVVYVAVHTERVGGSVRAFRWAGETGLVPFPEATAQLAAAVPPSRGRRPLVVVPQLFGHDPAGGPGSVAYLVVGTMVRGGGRARAVDCCVAASAAQPTHTPPPPHATPNPAAPLQRTPYLHVISLPDHRLVAVLELGGGPAIVGLAADPGGATGGGHGRRGHAAPREPTLVVCDAASRNALVYRWPLPEIPSPPPPAGGAAGHSSAAAPGAPARTHGSKHHGHHHTAAVHAAPP